jgi:hypothetical protein
LAFLPIINDQGELLGVKITAGNADDRDPVLELARALFGKLFGDRGYISQALFEQLRSKHGQSSQPPCPEYVVAT